MLVLHYRVMFPLDGAGLKYLFHNGRGRNDDFDWFSFDDVTKRKLLRQNKLDRGHYEIGPALNLQQISSFSKIYLEIELNLVVKDEK